MLYPIKTKDPASALDFKFDWGSDKATAPWLEPGETIQTHIVTVTAGLTKDSDLVGDAGRSVIVWLSGGTAGTTYIVTCTITTNTSRTDVRRMSIHVQNR
ncbi:hypothetical protein [Nocardia sp. NPDC051463]|uniref:phage fiber-tail adaptor protein n=1 Tax=Nocardia sp. NPDC051463 TaxID=3154845 RepID=UPI00344D57D7